MLITFNELRRIKDSLPSGSMQRIADELGINADEVRNYFGGRHFEGGGGSIAGVHFQPGPDGGIVNFEDTRIYECALRLLKECQPAEAAE
ncbi:MAG: DNA-binding protein [Tidjanibacter sp.]|nr:DNA-binding protein [Tidjanibacter sp.]